MAHLLLAHHRILQVVGLLQRGHRRSDDLVGELDVLLVEGCVLRRGAQEEHPRRLLPQREAQRDGGAGLHRLPLGFPGLTDVLIQRVGRRITHQHHLPGGERMPDLGIPPEIDRQVVEHRVLECRHYGPGLVLGARDDDRATRDVESVGHPPDQDLVDLLRLQRGGHFLHDVHHLGAGAGLGPGLVELAPDPEVRLHPGEQLAHPERFGDEVSGTETEGANRGLFRRHRRDHEHRQVLEARVGFHPLEQLQSVDLGHHDVQQEQVEGLRLQVLEQQLATRHGHDLVAVLLENPR